MAQQLHQQIANARRCSTPLLTIDTEDPSVAIRAAIQAVNGGSFPIVQWDVAAGFRALNEPARPVVAELVGEGEDPTIGNPFEAARLCREVPPRTCVLFLLGHRFIQEPGMLQAVWNCRDKFAEQGQTLILVTNAVRLPAELRNDVLLLTDPLPDEAEVGGIIDGVVEDASVACDDELRNRLIDATIGLPAFAIENAIALHCDPKGGIDPSGVWERKRKAIEQSGCLKVFRESADFKQIGGCEQIIQYCERYATGPERPRCVVVVDEIEKALGGAAGDTSGVSQDQLQVLLTEMNDRDYTGVLFYGVAGSGKSQVAKSIGYLAGCPTLMLDLGGAKEQFVGASERNIRSAMQAIQAISRGRAFFVGTCNRTGSLPPELMRRFSLGRWFFDIPTPQEQAAIWPIWITAFGLPMSYATRIPPHKDWTGAEIRNCCRNAKLLNCDLFEAATYVVPLAQATPQVVTDLRNAADGKFLSASYPGTYRKTGPDDMPQPGARRRRRINDLD